MIERGTHTLREILSQPTVWQETLSAFQVRASDLDGFVRSNQFKRALFTGCGSTYYLSLTAAALFQGLSGLPCQVRPASELALFPRIAILGDDKTLLVAISRSGETSETLAALPVFREQTGGQVLVITCDGQSSLAKHADFVLAAETAQEQSVAQTRSFSSMALLTQALAAQVAGYPAIQALTPLAGIVERVIHKYQESIRHLAETTSIENFFFLGAGTLYGIACEAMLKMKEMSLSQSEAFHPLEFRHGPMSMVTERSLVVGLLSEGALRQELFVLRDMHALGGRILVIGERIEDLPEALAMTIELASGLPEWTRPVLYLPPLQLLAYHRAMARGQNPDRPHNLEAVVHLESLE